MGCVCSERLQELHENPIAEGYNRYWELDQMQKRLESSLGCLLGANGSIFALRKHLCRPIPNDVCNDMVQPIWVAAAGHACLYEPSAVSFEAGSRNLGDELKRRSRIIGRGIRGIRAVWSDVVRGRAWLLAIELLSRKGLLRAALVPPPPRGSRLAPARSAGRVRPADPRATHPGGFALPKAVKRLLSRRCTSARQPRAHGWWKVLTGSTRRWQTAERPYETARAPGGWEASS